MLHIEELHIWAIDKKGQWYTPGIRNGKPWDFRGKQIVIVPRSQSIAQMKIDVALELSRIKPKLESYYVVAVAQKSDGTPIYRTIVPMTVIIKEEHARKFRRTRTPSSM